MDNWLLNNILTFALAIIVVGALIPQIIIISYRKKLFDNHDERKVHAGAVPRLGGVAFVPGIIFSVMLILGLCIKFNVEQVEVVIHQSEVGLFFLFCSLMLLYLLGIADDLVEVRYRAKFLFQIIAGLLTICSGVWLGNLHGFMGFYEIPCWLGGLFTVFVIVYIINAMNLIDGIDGLAGSIAFITLGYYGWAFFDAGYYIYSMVAFGAAGGLVPFIGFNVWGDAKRNHKIFMGDTGSLTLGMVIAFLAVAFTNVEERGNIFANINADVVVFTPLAIPVFDQCRVFFHRVIRRRNPFMPDRCHIHHKLMMLGVTPKQTLICIVATTVLAIVFNMWLSAVGMDITLIIAIDFAIWILVNMLLTAQIRRQEKRIGETLYK